MSYLRLYIVLSIALAPAFTAAATNDQNRGVIMVLIAVLLGYAISVLVGANLLRRFRGRQNVMAA